MLKYKWKVQPEPTGRYRSFEKRGWPNAETHDGDTIAMLDCKDDYSAHRLRTGDHGPIKLMIRRNNGKGEGRWEWATFKREFATIEEAKEFFKGFLERNPDHDFCFKK